jgi:hypothetical protein
MNPKTITLTLGNQATQFTPEELKSFYKALVPLFNDCENPDVLKFIKTLEYSVNNQQQYFVDPYDKLQSGKELAIQNGVTFQF